MNLSKSRYVLGKRCEKLLWLSCYKKDELEEQSNDSVLENGNKIGELARHLFGDDYILIEYNEDKQVMIDTTFKYLKESPNVICEASFSYEGNFCSVDILKNNIDGVEIYEVKSSTHLNQSYIDDITYQTWLLNKCGLIVKKSYLIYVNDEYIKQGELNINKFFVVKDVSDLINIKEVEGIVSKLKKVINSKEEPMIDLGTKCKKNKNIAYNCPFFKYCTKNLPSPNVFDVGWNLHFSNKLNMYFRNHISYEDLINKETITNKKALKQISSYLNNSELTVNKDNIKKFLKLIKYPLYFLDFESFQEPIPNIDGTKPYQQICFQYSLHYYLEEDGELYHKEYLSEDYNGNPMYELCQRLCEDIPLNSCVIVYNESFEKTRLREMADLFPKFRKHLLNIRDNVVDLWKPFNNQDYYVKEMGGSSSIKIVLPSLFPDDPDCDYHNLDQVHKGDEASAAYLLLPTLSKDERDKLRYNMLKYCKRDTYATVKLYEKLREVVKS